MSGITQPAFAWRGPDAGPTLRLARSLGLAAARQITDVADSFYAPALEMPDVVYAEAIIGDNNLRPIAFLALGSRIARAVAMVEIPAIGDGTGFLIGRDVLLTNNHVISSEVKARKAVIHFNYEKDIDGNDTVVRKVRCAPSSGFQTSKALDSGADADHLDYTVVKLAEPVGDEYGWIDLDPGVSIGTGDDVAVIQHPDGQPKKIAIADNEVVYADDLLVQYLTDTNKGSSGSPVFNDSWEVVALHHSGGDIVQPGDPQRHYQNEGIAIGAIIEKLPVWATAG
jgi:S1-C subfamily serine protease